VLKQLDFIQLTLPETRLHSFSNVGLRCVSEPGADRGPRAGSPRGVVDATGS